MKMAYPIGTRVMFKSPSSPPKKTFENNPLNREWNIRAEVTAVKLTTGKNGYAAFKYDLDLFFDEGRYHTRIHSVDSSCVGAIEAPIIDKD